MTVRAPATRDESPPGLATRLVILGGGGNAADILDIVDAANSRAPVYELVGVLDDNAVAGSKRYGAPVIGKISEARGHAASARLVNAIGSDASYHVRRTIIQSLALDDDAFATLRHPGSAISPGATLGAGSYASFAVSVGRGASIGRHVHLGAGVIIGHDAIVEDYALIAAGAVISGSVVIGAGAYVGAGSAIRQKLRIGAGALVGIGAVVTRDVAPGTVVAGNPARELPGRSATSRGS